VSRKVFTVKTAEELFRPLVKRGVIPSNATRVIIDAKVGQCVRVMYEVFGDDALLRAITECDFQIKDTEE